MNRLRRRGVRAAFCAGLLTLIVCVGASAQDQRQDPGQDARPDSSAATPTQQAPVPFEPPPRRPGLLESIGRWFDNSVTGLGAGLKNTQERLGTIGTQSGEAATGVARGAVDAVARLPATRVIDGRERCALAANGAPDCVAAATAICRGKGFNSGQSMNVESAQKCSARALLLGKRSSDAECQVETFVTRAMCR
jgi:hypothetical protein